MGFWDKVKDFVGIEDEYYEEDDFYEEDIENDKSSENITRTSYADKDVSEKNDLYENKKEDKPTRSLNYNSYPSKDISYNQSRSKGLNDDMIVTIKEPLTYEDGKEILDDVKAGKTVVLNLEMLEMDKKTQIFYFVSGGLYSLEGSMQNVTKDIYVLVPKGVQVDGKLQSKISEKSLYQI